MGTNVKDVFNICSSANNTISLTCGIAEHHGKIWQRKKHYKASFFSELQKQRYVELDNVKWMYNDKLGKFATIVRIQVAGLISVWPVGGSKFSKLL